MCGRVRLSSDYSELKIQLEFDLDAPAPNLEQNWNLPPTGRMLVAIRSEDGKRVPQMMRWGLLPRWAKDEKLSYSTFNARADGIATKPAFREAWKRGQRCLVVTDGFYEWRKSDKQPFAIGIADGKSMVMAGLWDEWTAPNGERIRSCTVITTEANAAVGALHDRMPVILTEDQWPKWLGEEPCTPDEALTMLKPCADELLKVWPVDKKVGNVRNTGPELAQPVML